MNDRYDASWLAKRDEIVTRLVDDAGITRARVELRSGIENPVDYWTQFVTGKITYNALRDRFYEKVNDDTNPNSINASGYQWASFDYYVENFVLPLQTKLASKGQKLYINLCFVDFNTTPYPGTLSFSGSPAEYAEIVTAAAQRLKTKYGLTLDALEIILEPNYGAGWTGVAVGQALLAAKTRLAAAGFAPKFIAPSTSWASLTTQWLDGIESVSGAGAALNVLSYHRYDGTAGDAAIPTIRQRAARLNAETAMLEYVDASVKNFFQDMDFGGASAWQAYGVASLAANVNAVKGGYVLWQNPAGALALTPQFSPIALIQREVKPGARAYFAAQTLGNDLPLVFRNPDNSEVVAVYSETGSTAEISGLGHRTYQVTVAGPNGAAYTTSTAVADSSGRITLAIPFFSVAVLHSTD